MLVYLDSNEPNGVEHQSMDISADKSMNSNDKKTTENQVRPDSLYFTNEVNNQTIRNFFFCYY